MKPEILAPCGSMASLRAAVDAGADAVYLGLDTLNMRAGATRNFTRDGLREASQLCREKGVRLYLTLNTIAFNSELGLVRSMLDFARDLVDAAIVSDWGVISACRESGVAWHASTQMSCSNTASAKFLASQGARRIVMARECTLDEVRDTATQLHELGVGIEIFVHGAQCMAESGRCFLSHAAWGKSANRGECLQPCRRAFRLVEEQPDDPSREAVQFSVGSHTIFSARDLCSLPFIPEILSTGAESLKIEGRARPPEYVAATVGAYREAVDAAIRGEFSDELVRILEERIGRVFHRRFGEGLCHGRPGGGSQWTDNDENLATRIKRHVGIVLKDWAKAGVCQIQVQDQTVSEGDEICIQGPTTGHVAFTATGMRRDEESLAFCGKGEWFTVRRPALVREGDKVYKFVARTSQK